jgi:hypothetical protein
MLRENAIGALQASACMVGFALTAQHARQVRQGDADAWVVAAVQSRLNGQRALVCGPRSW